MPGKMMLAAALCGALALWVLGYWCRPKAASALKDQMLYQQLGMAKVDEMTGQQFGSYCDALLRRRGYHGGWITGSASDDHGADIIASGPVGYPVAV